MSNSPVDQHAAFLADVLKGLSSPQPSIPCKYLYDATGSELFEQICKTPEYYVTRADLALHEAHVAEFANLIGPGAHIIEFGAGSGIKTRKLLASLETPRAYTPIEISAAALAASTRDLSRAFPEIEIRPLQADYTQLIRAKDLALDPPAQRKIVYFPGSTISNFTHSEAQTFLKRMRRIAGRDGGVLIGVDLVKQQKRLLAAYDDAAGITAAFNLNLLDRLARELDAALNREDFAHEARYNSDKRRVEMHLVARRDTQIELAGQEFTFSAGQSIHTENSHKYSVRDFRQLAESAGLKIQSTWKDPEGLFSMHFLRPMAPARRAPTQ